MERSGCMGRPECMDGKVKGAVSVSKFVKRNYHDNYLYVTCTYMQYAFTYCEGHTYIFSMRKVTHTRIHSLTVSLRKVQQFLPVVHHLEGVWVHEDSPVRRVHVTKGCD